MTESWWTVPGALDNPEAEQRRMAYAGRRPILAYEARMAPADDHGRNRGLWSTIWGRPMPWQQEEE